MQRAVPVGAKQIVGTGSMVNLLVLLFAVQAALLTKTTWPITGYVVGSLALTAWQSRDAGHLRWYRAIRPAMLLQNGAVLAVVGGVAVGLLALQNPILDFGWYSVIAAQAGGGGGNIITAPLSQPVLIAPFALLLLFVLPRLAESEELIFRRGTRGWRQGIARSLLFGLVHMLVGVPLAAALALSIGGLWFTYQYFLGGVPRSTVYHLSYNLLVALLIAVAMLLS